MINANKPPNTPTIIKWLQIAVRPQEKVWYNTGATQTAAAITINKRKPNLLTEPRTVMVSPIFRFTG
jgi:hypothetical protein